MKLWWYSGERITLIKLLYSIKYYIKQQQRQQQKKADKTCAHTENATYTYQKKNIKHIHMQSKNYIVII